MMNYRETTKQGYEILSLVDTGAMIAEDRPYLLAIAKRETVQILERRCAE